MFRTSKPAPVVTQAFTTSMEDMIRRRIKESNFSDVLPPKEAKAVSSEEGAAAEIDLSQEKSKQGLGEVYAEEFLAKSLNAQPEAVSKRLEQDRLEAQEYFHKVMICLSLYRAFDAFIF
jgi:U3 small nucleolar RNA-associated protein MPP10